MANDLFAAAAQTPTVQAMAQRLEQGSVLPCGGVSAGAQPFLAVLLHRLFPQRPVIVVAEGLKTQESHHQDITTWLKYGASQNGNTADSPPANQSSQLLFYPAWEVLPHEGKLPHVDVISERLETLAALSSVATVATSGSDISASPIVVASVTALLQRTYPPQQLRQRIRTVQRGDPINPLDLIEWLEDLGYEPEAQVNHKGEIALRGGILDIFPPTSPWPVRLEFFGNEVESLRFFDPISQMSREPITSVLLSPAGELGVLKKELALKADTAGPPASSHQPSTSNHPPALATLLDYLPRAAIWLLCEPEALAETAGSYADLVPEEDSFHIDWEDFRSELADRGMTQLELSAEESVVAGFAGEALLPPDDELASASEPSAAPLDTSEASVGPLDAALGNLAFSSLDAFRPIVDRAPEPAIAEAQRREFFAQLHRWLRQSYQVHVFCNNDGERQRFHEIWEEYGLGDAGSAPRLPSTDTGNSLPENASSAVDAKRTASLGRGRGAPPVLHLGALTRGFLSDSAKLVVVTDAEIFGRYKVQRPRRLKSPHAQATRSALDIDFTDLEEGDYVVHVQHGIGRYLGLKLLPPPTGTSRRPEAPRRVRCRSQARNAW